MKDAATRLDERFSDPGTEATDWAAAQAVLDGAQLTWISTVRADGRPHVTPLVAVWLDGRLHFCTGAAEQKGVNLAANPHVVLTTGRNTWDDALDVMVEGEARRITDRPTLERLAAAWREKWDGRWTFEAGDEGFGDGDQVAFVYGVEPTKVLAFGRVRTGEEVAFTHTTHVPQSGS